MRAVGTRAYAFKHLAITLNSAFCSESDEDSDDSEGSYDTHEDGVDYEGKESGVCPSRVGA